MSKHIKKSMTKSTLAIVASVLLALIVVGGTVAYIVASSNPVVNKFKPSKVTIDIPETLAGNVKKDVKVRNTGDTNAYIRARIVVTWKDAEGNVFGETPKVGTDYIMTMPTDTDWFQGSDGFYYYKNSVVPQAETGILIASCRPVEGKAPEGYNLSVEIIAQGIQSEPAKAVNEAWKVVEVKNGILEPVTQ